MKKISQTNWFRFFGLIVGAVVLLANGGDPPNANTGAPFNGTCASCHDNPTPTYAGDLVLEGLPGAIEPNTTYPLTVRLNVSGGSPLTGGYQLVCVDNNNANCGDLTLANTESGLVMVSGREYVEQRGEKAFSGGTVSWDFNWKSPATAAGNTIKFYFIGNFSNNNNNDGGDLIVPAVETYTLAASNPVTAAIANSIDVTCFGLSNGSATVEAGGGTGTFTYLWSNGQTTATASNLAAGTYSVTVTSGSSTSATSVTINQPSAINLSIAGGGTISCFSPTVELTAEASGGVGNYNFSWSTGINSNVIEVSNSGTYSVTVIDGNNCTKTASANVTANLTPPSANAGMDQSLSCTITQVTLNGSGSSGANFTYEWTTPNGHIVSGANTLTPIVNAPGTYTLTVMNTTNGCSQSDEVTVNEIISPPNLSATGGVITCAQPSITLNASSTTPNVSYLWSGPGITPNNQTLPNPSVSVCGTYSVQISNPANGCTNSTQVQVTCDIVPPTLTVNGTVTLTCTNPQAVLPVSSNTGGLNWSWNGPNGFTSTMPNPVVSDCGVYNCAVVNPVNGCANATMVDVNCDQAPPNLSVTGAAITCANANPQVCANSLTPGVQFSWAIGGNQACATVNLPGNYAVVATAPNGCTSMETAVVSENTATPAVAIAPPANLNCVTPMVQINASASAQGSNYLYNWSSANGGNITGGQNTLTPTVNAAGIYTLLITNSLTGCSASASTTVSQSQPVTASAVSTAAPCFGAGTGTASVTPGGGVGAYSYLWNNSATTASITGLSAGVYSVTVSDGENCTATASAEVTQPNLLSVSVSTTPQSALGVNDGTATAQAGGGTPGYNYLWNTGATSSSIAGLAPGAYSVTLTDQNGCTAIQTGTVAAFNCTSSATISGSDVSCFGAANGSAAVMPNGSGAPYQFNWSNGATTNNISGLNPGLFSVTMTDAGACQTFLSVQINQPTLLLANATATPVSGVGLQDGTASAAPSGGVAPYSFAWSNGATTSTITGLASGSYTVTVYDSRQCSQIQSVQVNNINCTLSLNLLSSNPPCYGALQGTAGVVVSGATGQVTYLWSNGATISSLSGLAAGEYAVIVQDAVGCVASSIVTLTQPPILTATASMIEQPDCPGDANGSVLIVAEGGTPPYPYQWPGETINNLIEGSYTLTITDSQNCNATVSFTIAAHDTVPPTVACPPAITMCGAGVVNFEPVTSTDNCIISAVNAEPPAGSEFPVGETTVTYSVADQSGNLSTCSFVVTIYAFSVISNIVVTDDVDGQGIGGIQITPVGAGPFLYEWSKDGAFFSNLEDLTGLQAGEYQLVLTDANGCSTTTSPISLDNTVGGAEKTADIQPARIIPNPTNASFFLELSGNYVPVKGHIIQMQGGLVKSLNQTELRGPVDVSHLQGGLYLLLLWDESGQLAVLRWTKTD
jgi:hypothetical protein